MHYDGLVVENDQHEPLQRNEIITKKYKTDMGTVIMGNFNQINGPKRNKGYSW